MNLKLRLNLIITVLLLLVISLGVFSTIYDARKNVQAEIASTALLAVHMLDAEVLRFSTGSGWSATTATADSSVFKLQTLSDVRHLKIDFYDARGGLIDSNQVQAGEQEDVDSPPNWFVSLMDSVTKEMPVTKRRVFKAGHVVGELVVTPDPSNEIAEVWEETKSTLELLGMFFIVVNILIYWAVGRALRPIDDILAALTEVEMGNLKSRLPKFTLPELSGISDKFNIMAETLENSIDSNHHLTQKMIELQEDERKNLARELHDEIGQHLTAIHIDASAILKAKTMESANESASAIDVVARQMMEIVHTMLHRLRPSGLDELGLEPALQELISGWSHRQKSINVSSHVTGDYSDVAEVVLLSVYRIIQECLTNIARHSQATHVNIIVEKRAHNIELSIKDNGQGFDQSIKPKGFGLAGMNERVDGLGGNLTINSQQDGVHIGVTLPCKKIEEKTK